MNHNILKSSIFWNLFFNRESKSQATALWHLLCSYISTSTVLQFVLMHNTFQSIGKYTYFLKQKIIWEVTTEPCSQLFKKLKILACLGAKLGYRTKFQNSYAEVFHLTLVKMKLMDTLQCQDFDYLMNDCYCGWLPQKGVHFFPPPQPKWTSWTLWGTFCSDNLEVLYYDFYNESFAHWNDI